MNPSGESCDIAGRIDTHYGVAACRYYPSAPTSGKPSGLNVTDGNLADYTTDNLKLAIVIRAAG
jgi:hypothetical protein